MLKEQFENAWAKMSYDDRTRVLVAAIEQAAKDVGLPVPRIEFLPVVGPLVVDDEGTVGEAFAEVDDDGRIIYYTQTPLVDGTMLPQIDDPREALDTAYHEFNHYALMLLDPNGEFGDAHPEIRQVAQDRVAEFLDDVENDRLDPDNEFVPYDESGPDH